MRRRSASRYLCCVLRVKLRSPGRYSSRKRLIQGPRALGSVIELLLMHIAQSGRLRAGEVLESWIGSVGLIPVKHAPDTWRERAAAFGHRCPGGTTPLRGEPRRCGGGRGYGVGMNKSRGAVARTFSASA